MGHSDTQVGICTFIVFAALFSPLVARSTTIDSVPPDQRYRVDAGSGRGYLIE